MKIHTGSLTDIITAPHNVQEMEFLEFVHEHHDEWNKVRWKDIRVHLKTILACHDRWNMVVPEAWEDDCLGVWQRTSKDISKIVIKDLKTLDERHVESLDVPETMVIANKIVEKNDIQFSKKKSYNSTMVAAAEAVVIEHKRNRRGSPLCIPPPDSQISIEGYMLSSRAVEEITSGKFPQFSGKSGMLWSTRAQDTLQMDLRLTIRHAGQISRPRHSHPGVDTTVWNVMGVGMWLVWEGCVENYEILYRQPRKMEVDLSLSWCLANLRNLKIYFLPDEPDQRKRFTIPGGSLYLAISFTPVMTLSGRYIVPSSFHPAMHMIRIMEECLQNSSQWSLIELADKTSGLLQCRELWDNFLVHNKKSRNPRTTDDELGHPLLTPTLEAECLRKRPANEKSSSPTIGIQTNLPFSSAVHPDPDQCSRIMEWCDENAKSRDIGTVDNMWAYLFFAKIGARGRIHSFLPGLLPGAFLPSDHLPYNVVCCLRILRWELSRSHFKNWENIFAFRFPEILGMIAGSPVKHFMELRLMETTLFRYMTLETSQLVRVVKITFPGQRSPELGIVAATTIPKDTFLWELTGVLSADVYKKDAISLAYPHSSQRLIGGPRILSGPLRFCNHSCKPNSILYALPDKPAFVVQTIQKIPPEVEVTVSYGQDYWKGKNCLCRHCVIWSVPEP